MSTSLPDDDDDDDDADEDDRNADDYDDNDSDAAVIVVGYTIKVLKKFNERRSRGRIECTRACVL